MINLPLWAFYDSKKGDVNNEDGHPQRSPRCINVAPWWSESTHTLHRV